MSIIILFHVIPANQSTVAMTNNEFLLNGKRIKLGVASDRLVAERVAKHMQRRICEDDWRPYSSKAKALEAWTRLGGIRVAVLQALDMI